MLAAYVANGEGKEGSHLEVLENFVGNNLVTTEAGEEQRTAFCDEKGLGRMLLSALRLATFYCKKNMIQGWKGVQ